MYFGKITQCLADVQRMIHGDVYIPAHREVAEAFCQALMTGQRFFFPDPRDVLDGRKYTDEFKKDLRLPFDITVLLHHSFIEGDDGNDEVSVWVVTAAFRSREMPNNRIVLMSATEIPGHGWVMIPGAALLDMNHGSDDIAVDFDGPSFTNEEKEKLRKEFYPDAHAVIGLMTMLSTSNVGVVHCSPPDKLQRKRLKRGNPPLLSYHVLEVGGDRWDTVGVRIGSGSGKRSHLRRGHIRRLATGVNVWVSSCFVRGSQPGLVLKDYKLKGAKP